MTLIALLTSLFSRIVSAAHPSRTAPVPAAPSVPHAAWREASACRERLLQHDLASWRSSFGI